MNCACRDVQVMAIASQSAAAAEGACSRPRVSDEDIDSGLEEHEAPKVKQKRKQ